MVAIDPVTLEDGPLRLRPWREDDVDAVWAAFQDPDITLWNGGGVSSRAVEAACRWAFATLPIDRIELCHAVENAASGRVAEKAGFTYEGHLRRSYRYGDGVKHDELLWARLADDPAPALSSRS